jgi:hypothetical protein
MHADLLKKTINDTVQNFYKQPQVYKRKNDFDDDNSEGPIRDLVDKKGPMGGKKANKKDLDITSKTADVSKTILTEKLMGEPTSLGNDVFNEKADEIKDARERMSRKIYEPSLDDSKSKRSKGRKSKINRNSVIGLQSVISAGTGVNDS